MSDAEFFAGLTGAQNDFARDVEALRANGRAFCLIGALASTITSNTSSPWMPTSRWPPVAV